MLNKCVIVLLVLVFGLGTGLANGGKPVIKDYRKHLNRKFKKQKRKSTRFIIIHTSEAGLTSTLRTLSQGKGVRGRYRTV
ncbi:MAG: hypothetical protein GY950_14170, partial [bacterium]|nr:hypothetical protein [bacterium]